MTDGAIYVATDTGTMWLGTSATALLQIKDNIDTNTTYTLEKSGSNIQLKNQSGTIISTVVDSNTTYAAATQSAAGLMSAADKKRLDGMADNANNITVDSSLSSTSTNPVQNKVVNAALAGKSSISHNHDSVYVKKAGDTMSGKLKITGTAASQPLQVSGIVGSDESANTVTDLHLQFGANAKIILGNTGAHNISADGGTYTGKAATAGTADKANSVAWANVSGKPSTYAPSSHSHSTYSPTQIAANTDLNSLVTPGWYYSPADATVATFKNSPTANAFWMEVSQSAGCTQIVCEYKVSSFKVYIRSKYQESWGNWQRIYTTANRPTASEIGAAASSHTHTKSQITDFPSSMPASDVYAWAKASSKPSYTKSEVGLGNVDNTADANKSVKYAATAGSTNKLLAIEAGGDLNSLTSEGTYYAGGLNACTNKPSGVDAFGLMCVRTAAGYICQVLIEANTNERKTWMRSYGSGAWSSWDYVFTSKYTPSWSQISDKPTFAAVATSGSYNDLSNKPTIPTALKSPNALTISLNGNSQGAYDGSAAKSFNITAASVGAAASSHNHAAENITSGTLSIDRIPNVNSKVTVVDVSKLSGTIDASHLPSYVDDVLEYESLSKFPTEGETGKIYTATDTNKIYRWSGSAYVVISDTIALGTTHASAGYGDESRAAYNHSTVTSGNPHNVTKSDVGLGNVENKSSATIRGEITKANVTTALGYTPPTTNTTYNNATQSAAGLMSIDDKKKLDGIASGANNYTYTLPQATSTVLGGVKVGSNITVSSGTISVSKANVVAALGYTPPTTNTTYAALTSGEIDAAYTAVFG